MKSAIAEFEAELRLLNAEKRRIAAMPSGDAISCRSLGAWLSPAEHFIKPDEAVRLADCSTTTLATIRRRMKSKGLDVGYVEAEIRAREYRFRAAMQQHVDVITGNGAKSLRAAA